MRRKRPDLDALRAKLPDPAELRSRLPDPEALRARLPDPEKLRARLPDAEELRSRRPSPDVLRAKREALEERLAAQRARLREPAPKQRRWWLLLLPLILLLLLRDCACSEPPPPAPTDCCPCEEGPTGEAVPAPEPEPEPRVKPGRIEPRPRPAFRPPAPRKLDWIGDFRLQVAARSARLAACFEGVPTPGSLKWTTSVEPVEGTVGEHDLEPMLLSAELTGRQRRCVLEVLEDPGYRLTPGEEPSTPSRVSLVIEF